jgi:hypothetical protein
MNEHDKYEYHGSEHIMSIARDDRYVWVPVFSTADYSTYMFQEFKLFKFAPEKRWKYQKTITITIKRFKNDTDTIPNTK